MRFALAREAGLPVVLDVAEPLEPHAQRLMDTLGVEVRLVTRLDRPQDLVRGARGERSFVSPLSGAAGGGPRADWIDYRASVARVHKREQVGDEALTCPGCGTETDVTDVVHSPKCSHLAAGAPDAPPPRPRMSSDVLGSSEPTEGLDLLEQMDRGERIASPAEPEGEPMPDIVCKIDGCDRDASDAPKAGPTARLCETHRAQRGQEISAARTGKPRGAKITSGAEKTTRSRTAERPPHAVPDRAAAANGNGSHTSKAERLLSAARAVDEIEAQLEQARAELKEAAAALA